MSSLTLKEKAHSFSTKQVWRTGDAIDFYENSIFTYPLIMIALGAAGVLGNNVAKASELPHLSPEQLEQLLYVDAGLIVGGEAMIVATLLLAHAWLNLNHLVRQQTR